MNEDKKPSKEACEQLQRMLQRIAEPLGLLVEVTPSPVRSYAFSVEAYPIVQRAIVTLDEDLLFTFGHYGDPSPRASALFDVLYREVETLQMKTFDETRKHLDTHDKRGRIVALSREDKYTLNGMYRDAELEEVSHRNYTQKSYDEVDKLLKTYRDLVERLMR